MPDVKSQLNELIRQTKSSYHDSKHHGEGFLIVWDTKKRKTLEKKNFLSFLFSDRYEYYFVKSHSKPIMISDVEFSWHEGTSEISLDFNASFQLKISTQEEAEKLVATLASVGQPDIGLYNLIDRYLYEVMTDIYQKSTDEKQNLLKEFYQNGLQRGESTLLNQKVSSCVAKNLQDTEFKIGFTLRNAPEHHVYYKHSTPITKPEEKLKESESLMVESDCRLTLSNYQAYKKSGIKDDKGLKKYIESSINSAIRNNMLGKSLMELLGNFRNGTGGKKPIAVLIKEEVWQKAQDIGYELESFHTLPDIAALQLLEGIAIVFDEYDSPLKVGAFGGKIKLNIRMSVQAIDGRFEQYKHFVTIRDNDFSKHEIKKPVQNLCVEVLRQYQQIDVLRDFDSKIKEVLKNTIIGGMEEQHGLAVVINTLQPIESEDASRLEELRGNKHVIEFDFVSNSETEDTAKITVTTAFQINTVDFNNTNSWTAFEQQDFGYRIASPVRNKNRDNVPARPTESGGFDLTWQGLGYRSGSPLKNDNQAPPKTPSNSYIEYDRAWKNIAIEDEIQSIRAEIIRAISNSPAFVIDIRLWLFDVKHKKKIEEKIIGDAKESILISRGLHIDIEPFITKDEILQKAQLEFRDKELISGNKKQEQRHKLELERRIKSEERNQVLESALVSKTADIIDNADEDDGIEELLKIKEKTLDTAHRLEKSSKSSIADFVTSGREAPQKSALLEELTSGSGSTQHENSKGE